MWQWKSNGESVQVAGFDSQELAEEWLKDNYEDLLDQGVLEVSLYEGDRLVYGPMSLEPA